MKPYFLDPYATLSPCAFLSPDYFLDSYSPPSPDSFLSSDFFPSPAYSLYPCLTPTQCPVTVSTSPYT
jgi:hypothetical protein